MQPSTTIYSPVGPSLPTPYTKSGPDYSGFIRELRTKLNRKDFKSIPMTQTRNTFRLHPGLFAYLLEKKFLDYRMTASSGWGKEFRLNDRTDELTVDRLTRIVMKLGEEKPKRSLVKVTQETVLVSVTPQVPSKVHKLTEPLETLKNLLADQDWVSLNQSEFNEVYGVTTEFFQGLRAGNYIETRKIQGVKNKEVKANPSLFTLVPTVLEKALSNSRSIRFKKARLEKKAQQVFVGSELITKKPTQTITEPETIIISQSIASTTSSQNTVSNPSLGQSWEYFKVPITIGEPLPDKEPLKELSMDWKMDGKAYGIQVIITAPAGEDYREIAAKGLNFLGLK